MGAGEETDDYEIFSKLVIARMKEPPFYCIEDCKGEEFSKAGAYAGQLHDAMYVYARALNATLTDNPLASFRDGDNIMGHIGMQFEGPSRA
ncbi:unnamed protein product [Cylicostephanus goldi]|uniref:Receptor ligand binding region domain-containing protein n=1 Tax=Cylicostephanus goldi TaxID=71465 RepID=A0A3P6QY22_CYLGO|nr:unnamed protein product [Cylicostephanus goldi]